MKKRFVASLAAAFVAVSLLNGCAVGSLAGIGAGIALDDAAKDADWQRTKYLYDFYGTQSIDVNCWLHPGVDPETKVTFGMKRNTGTFGKRFLRCNAVSQGMVLPQWSAAHVFEGYTWLYVGGGDDGVRKVAIAPQSFPATYENAQRLDIHVYAGNQIRLLFITGYPRGQHWSSYGGSSGKVPGLSPHYPFPLDQSVPPPQAEVGYFFNEGADLAAQGK